MLKNNWRKGEHLTAEFCNEVAKLLNKLQNIRGAGGIQVRYSATGVSIANMATPTITPLWATLTATDGAGKYSWSALTPDNSTNTWTPNSSAGSGDYTATSGFAREQTGFAYVPLGIPVELYFASGADPSFYTFVFPGDVLPVTLDSFNPGAIGQATVQGGTQQVEYLDLSNGSVDVGTSCTLSYLAGPPGVTPSESRWLLISTSC